MDWLTVLESYLLSDGLLILLHIATHCMCGVGVKFLVYCGWLQLREVICVQLCW